MAKQKRTGNLPGKQMCDYDAEINRGQTAVLLLLYFDVASSFSVQRCIFRHYKTQILSGKLSEQLWFCCGQVKASAHITGINEDG